jgi:hypothetical protein
MGYTVVSIMIVDGMLIIICTHSTITTGSAYINSSNDLIKHLLTSKVFAMFVHMSTISVHNHWILNKNSRVRTYKQIRPYGMLLRTVVSITEDAIDGHVLSYITIVW